MDTPVASAVGRDFPVSAYTGTTTDPYGDSEEEKEEEGDRGQGFSGEEDGVEGYDGSDEDDEMVVLDPDYVS